MSYSENCRECGEEIEPDITNPDALCEDCLKKKYGNDSDSMGGVF